MKFFNRKNKAPPEKKVLDVKTMLKLARKYIDEKNMKEARKYCKKILRKNKDNYMALVLLGKTFEGSDKAPITYKKAIELKPNHLLAWQGLANYYEGKDDISARMQLVCIYDKILGLDIEEDYAIKTLKKYGQLGCLLKNEDSISALIRYMNVQHNGKLIEIAKEQFKKLLESEVPFKDEDMSDIINILQNCAINAPNGDTSSCNLLVDIIFQNNEFGVAVDQVICFEIFSKSAIFRDFVCKKVCDRFIQNYSFRSFPIHHYIYILTRGVENNMYGGTLIAIMYYRQGEYRAAYQKCASSIKRADNTDVTEALFLLNCSRKMKNWPLTENLSATFLKKERPKLQKPGFILAVHKILISCYVDQKKMYQAIFMLKNIPIYKIDSIMMTEIGNLYFKVTVNSQVILNILESTDYVDLFKGLYKMKRGKYSEAIATLQIFDKHPIKNYYLARAYWRLHRYDECLESLQTAAALIPYHPKIFYCLGIYYYRQENDIQESKHYFEISYSLCQTDTDVIKMLSFIYDLLGRTDLEFDILETAFDTPETKEFWVCARLGRICYTKGVMGDAETYLQEAIEINPRDITAHEWIGDVFFSTRAYNEALHAYEKVVELSQDSDLIINCLNRIGTIYSIQRLFNRSIFVFDNILRIDPDNGPALKGVTENRLKVAEQLTARHSFEAARNQAQYAINRILTTMSNGNKDLPYYHLYGDALAFITRLPTEHSFILMPSSEGEIRKGKIAIYEMAIESYSNVAKNRDSTALFKCALIYFEYYIETKRTIFWQTAYNLSVLCTKTNPIVWRYWDLLGKICFHTNKYEIAHYCFFKAMTYCDDHNAPKVWCNLGTVYLKLNKVRLASYCFVVGQQALPAYPTDWIGDGLLAEILREDGNVGIFSPDPNVPVDVITERDFEEWVDMFTELCGPPNEPVFDLPLESLYIVPNAIDIIEWYLLYEKESVWSCISLGQLQEKKGTFSSALRYYERAYEIAEARHKNDVLLHKARILTKMHLYHDAVDVYRGIQNINFEGTCALAFALYKSDNYEDSYSVYNRILKEFCCSDDQRVDVLVTMSNVAYKLNGLCFGRKILLKAVRIMYASTPGRGLDLSFVKSYAFNRVDVELVAYVMSEYLYIHTSDAMWWYYMGLNYLRGTNQYAKLASLCIQKAVALAQNTEHVGEIGKMHAMISIAKFYAGDRSDAMEYAKQALDAYPAQSELWAALILCVYSQRNYPNRATWIREALHLVRQNITIPRSINEWLNNLVEKLPAN